MPIQRNVVNQSPVVISGDAATACGLWHALLARKLRFNLSISEGSDQFARGNQWRSQQWAQGRGQRCVVVTPPANAVMRLSRANCSSRSRGEPEVKGQPNSEFTR